jgi:transposase
LDVVSERCCGLDVHKKSITACIITPERKEIKTFGTMTGDLLALTDWVKTSNCSAVAMESTGVYWKPIYNLLEMEDIQTLVVNAQHIKAVPGRKTDVKDAEWIADLLRHGLLKGSYIPDRGQRELREIVRYRRSLINERTREVNRIQKVLEGCNIKLASVASDIMGVSSQSMLEAIVNGVEAPDILAGLAKGRLKSKNEDLKKALLGLVGPHQRMLLSVQLQHIQFMDKQIIQLDAEVKERMRPFVKQLELLDTIPGINIRTAEDIIAETGVDMNQFPTSAHFAAWAGICPGSRESAGKKKSSRSRKGNKSLRYTLYRAATSASRTNDSYLSAQYHRIAARRGRNRAYIAVAHSIAVSIYFMLKRNEAYIDPGSNYFNERKRDYIVNSTIKKLESLGYKVTLETAA